MTRLTRPALAIALSATLLLGTFTLGGCMKPAPVLTTQQLQAGVVPEKHPVSQADATKKGCSCHLAAAKAAGAK